MVVLDECDNGLDDIHVEEKTRGCAINEPLHNYMFWYANFMLP